MSEADMTLSKVFSTMTEYSFVGPQPTVRPQPSARPDWVDDRVRIDLFKFCQSPRRTRHHLVGDLLSHHIGVNTLFKLICYLLVPKY